LLRTADLYLKEKGTIAFVLPRSIFTGDQHDDLRQGKFKNINLNFIEVLDCEEVKPLFNVPSCVLFAQKQPEAKVSYPISGQILRGKLKQRNASLDEAKSSLSKKNVKFYLYKKGKRSFWTTQRPKGKGETSFYKRYFFQGATIVPRSCWFVEVKKSPLGLDPNLPLVETSKRIKPGPVKTYENIKIEGNIESKFLYYTLLGDDLLPFGYRDLRLVVLPIEPSEDGYRLIRANEARTSGFVYLATWLNKVEKEWEERRGAKAKNINIYERLDSYRGLSRQNPQKKYSVLYPNFQRILTSTVIQKGEINFETDQQKLKLNNFIAESALYFFETESEMEAYYLCTFLNSSIVDRKIQNFRRRQQKAHPNIHKKIFDIVNIPQFDSSNDIHSHLAKMGKDCSQKVTGWLKSGNLSKIKSIGVLRSKVREMLNVELKEIDSLVQEILKSSCDKYR
jgi:hypothetical protein